MTITTIIILIVIGFATGMLGGFVGIGGGIVIVPALIFFLGFSQLQAQGTSLALIMLPVGILAVIQYYKQGYVDFSHVALLAAGFVAGSYLGSKVSLSASQDIVRKGFAILLLAVAVKMLFFDKGAKAKESVQTESGREG